MQKIVFTITPNPALDLSGVVKELKPNEKVYVYDEQRAPGGNSINTARILNRLKIPVVASGFLGGSTGGEIENLLEKEHLKHRFIKVAESSRVNVTVSNVSDHLQTRLSFPGPHIKRSEKQRLFDLVAKQRQMSMLVLGGSLPKGFGPADMLHVMKLAHVRGIGCVVDCPGDVLSQVIKGKPRLIKPNLEEFQILTRSRVSSLRAVHKKCQELLSDVEMICVSSVEEGALLVTRKGSFFGRIPRITVRSSVGAGDSMVGAMVAQLYQGQLAGESILRWGLASAAATLRHSGTKLGQASEIRSLSKKIKINEV
ncbi:MAG: 1-phosphofructokinase family hexose kinase [Bacillota bacterium]